MNGIPASQKEIDTITEMYPDNKADCIAKVLGCKVSRVYQLAYKLNVKKSFGFMKKRESGRFNKRNKPRNSFRKGSSNHAYKELGSVRKNKEGYLEIKLYDDMPSKRCWVLYHRAIWVQAHGEIPDGHIVAFKDGNKENLSIENLELRTLSDHSIMNNYVHEELREIVKLQKQLKRRIKGYEQNN